MYTFDEIILLQTNNEFYESENDRLCLIRKTKEVSSEVISNQAKFCVLQTIKGYKEGNLSRDEANNVINKIDAIYYGRDLLGNEKTFNKLNNDVINDELGTPFFNLMCVECDSLK